MVCVLSVLRRQVSDFKAANFSLKKHNQKLMQKVLSALHKTTGKKLDPLSATVPTAFFGIYVKVDRRFVS